MNGATTKSPRISKKRVKEIYRLMRVRRSFRNFPLAQFNYGHVEVVNEVNNRRFHTLFNRVRNISHARFTNFSAHPISSPLAHPHRLLIQPEKFPRVHTSLNWAIGLPPGRDATRYAPTVRTRALLRNFERRGNTKRLFDARCS